MFTVFYFPCNHIHSACKIALVFSKVLPSTKKKGSYLKI